MTGQERLNNICNRLPVDRIAWTTLVDDISRSIMSEQIRGMSPFDFYRYIGCDILQFGNYGLPESHQVIAPCRLVTPVEIEEHKTFDGLSVRKQKSPWGILTATFKNGQPIKFPVESIDELVILKNIWLNSHYEEVSGTNESYDFVNNEIGESGIYVPTLSPSPIQQLLEEDIGITKFYYLLYDYQKEMEELFDIMHQCRLQEYEIFAKKMPGNIIILVENTSSTFISPSIYEKYSLPQICDFVNTMHKYNKKAIIHMCGFLKDLLPTIKETGLDGINGLTPPPVGDVSFEETLDILGDDFVIMGGIFDQGIMHKTSVSTDEIEFALEKIFTSRIRNSNFLLWIGIDGIPISIDRLFAVRNWISTRGIK